MENIEILNKLIGEGFYEERVHTPEDAFMMLINGLAYEDLVNLCSGLSNRLISDYGFEDMTLEECYRLTQGKNLDEDLKKLIIEVAYELVDKGIRLGTNVNEAGFNTSSWISHSLLVARVCSVFAKASGINPDVAWTMGIMHDYGRRFDHRFEQHVNLGTEALAKFGWFEEASACKIHSYYNGGIAFNNERAPEGFFVDALGNVQYSSKFKQTELKEFLDKYPHTLYHFLLENADLMATDNNVMSVVDRLTDIEKRRTLDPINRGAFLAEVTNGLNRLYAMITGTESDDSAVIKASSDVSLSDITKHLMEASSRIYGEYTRLTAVPQKVESSKQFVK